MYTSIMDFFQEQQVKKEIVMFLSHQIVVLGIQLKRSYKGNFLIWWCEIWGQIIEKPGG